LGGGVNIIFLQTFLVIVETGSLVRASERLHVTQSTVSARLQTLEDDLGQVLLNRYKSGTTLTPAGAKLMRYAEIMTGLWRQARQETSLPKGTKAVCNFGCPVDLWIGLGSTFFESVNTQQPLMALSVLHGEQHNLEEALGVGLLDAVLTSRLAAKGDQKIHALKPDTLILCATERDRPMRFDPGYIYVDHGEDFRQQHALAYADAGTARVTLGTSEWALEFLSRNAGSAYLPERLARPYLADQRLFAIDHAPKFMRNIYLVVNNSASELWPWLDDLIHHLSN
jgi:DNA-binding transcriptional LysR family regulator